MKSESGFTCTFQFPLEGTPVLGFLSKSNTTKSIRKIIANFPNKIKHLQRPIQCQTRIILLFGKCITMASLTGKTKYPVGAEIKGLVILAKARHSTTTKLLCRCKLCGSERWYFQSALDIRTRIGCKACWQHKVDPAAERIPGLDELNLARSKRELPTVFATVQGEVLTLHREPPNVPHYAGVAPTLLWTTPAPESLDPLRSPAYLITREAWREVYSDPERFEADPEGRIPLITGDILAHLGETPLTDWMFSTSKAPEGKLWLYIARIGLAD